MQRSAVYFYRRNLPHWRVVDATYFVTWRLERDQPDLSCTERSVVADSLRHFDGQRYELFASVVMNDHVHAVVTPLGSWLLERLIHGWKSFTTHELCRSHGRMGRIWQTEYFDRVIRNETELWEKVTYVLQNPWTRWPELDDYPWLSVRE